MTARLFALLNISFSCSIWVKRGLTLTFIAASFSAQSAPSELGSITVTSSNASTGTASGTYIAAGSGATGLIQFMPATARGMGTTVEKLAKMSQIEQLNYVYKYFLPQKGKLRNLGDVYMTILWPAGIGKNDSYVLWARAKKPTTYRQNIGLDVNKDGVITRAECVAKVTERYNKGKKKMRKAA